MELIFFPLFYVLIYQVQSKENVASLKGKLFVFSHSPTTLIPAFKFRLTISISTFNKDTVKARLQCKRFCGVKAKNGDILENFSVRFGTMEIFRIPLSRDKVKVFEPFNQTVYSITSVKPVVVLLGEAINHADVDCAFIYPYSAADTEFIAIVGSTATTFLQIMTFHSKAKVKLKVLNQYGIMKRYSSSTGLKPTDHMDCNAKKGGCDKQTYPPASITSVKKIVFGKILEYNLVSFHVLTLYRFDEGCCDFSGSEITSSNPIVVKVGCDSTRYGLANNGDNTFEFLLSKKNLGKRFIIARNTLLELKANIKVLTSADSNKISFEVSGGKTESIELQKTGDWFSRLTDGKENIAILATKGTIVGYLFYNYEKAGPCFTIILPIALWGDSYIWADLDIGPEYVITYYATILAREPEKDGIVLDEEDSFSYTIFDLKLFNENKWASHSNKVTKGTHLAYQKEFNNPFMITIFGYKLNFGYCTMAGAIFRKANTECVPTETVPGDNIDNDCDGRFDEEVGYGKDSDKDGKIDEDLKAKPKINGKWSSWISNKECIADCGETTGSLYGKIRHCDNPEPQHGGLPCQGDATSSEKKECKKDLVLCSFDCAPFTYGFNCSEKCTNCIDPCDPETGECENCKNGFAIPKCKESCLDQNCDICSADRSCTKCKRGFLVNSGTCSPCSAGFYGDNCAQTCMPSPGCVLCKGNTGECTKCSKKLILPYCNETAKSSEDSSTSSGMITGVIAIGVVLILITSIIYFATGKGETPKEAEKQKDPVDDKQDAADDNDSKKEFGETQGFFSSFF